VIWLCLLAFKTTPDSRAENGQGSAHKSTYPAFSKAYVIFASSELVGVVIENKKKWMVISVALRIKFPHGFHVPLDSGHHWGSVQYLRRVNIACLPTIAASFPVRVHSVSVSLFRGAAVLLLDWIRGSHGCKSQRQPSHDSVSGSQFSGLWHSWSRCLGCRCSRSNGRSILWLCHCQSLMVAIFREL
jgi:hypothetical protein